MAKTGIAQHATNLGTALLGTLLVAALAAIPASTAGTSTEDVTEAANSAVSEERQSAVAAAQKQAADLEEQRMLELLAHGMPWERATEVVDAEQHEAAAKIRERIMMLTLKGMTINQIAAATPGLVVVAGPEDELTLLSSAEDMWVDRASITFYMQCSCYTVESEWGELDSLENGKDVVGLTMTKSTFQHMGGSLVYCNTYDCDGPYSTSYEDPNGVAHGFSTSQGSYEGVISFSYQGWLGCVQPYTHYDHAWTTVTITGVSIGAASLGVSWQYNDNEWGVQKKRAGYPYGC